MKTLILMICIISAAISQGCAQAVVVRPRPLVVVAPPVRKVVVVKPAPVKIIRPYFPPKRVVVVHR